MNQPNPRPARQREPVERTADQPPTPVTRGDDAVASPPRPRRAAPRRPAWRRFAAAPVTETVPRPARPPPNPRRPSRSVRLAAGSGPGHAALDRTACGSGCPSSGTGPNSIVQVTVGVVVVRLGWGRQLVVEVRRTVGLPAVRKRSRRPPKTPVVAGEMSSSSRDVAERAGTQLARSRAARSRRPADGRRAARAPAPPAPARWARRAPGSRPPRPPRCWSPCVGRLRRKRARPRDRSWPTATASSS